MQFSPELRNGVLAGDTTISIRLWRSQKVKEGRRYRVGVGEIEIDAVTLVPFSSISSADVRRSGEVDREAMRRRAAHAGPVHDDTLVYRVQFHAVGRPTA